MAVQIGCSLTGPGARTEREGVIAGGIVTNAGPAKAKLVAVAKEAKIANFLTRKGKPGAKFCKLERIIVQRESSLGRGLPGRGREKNQRHQ
jgi:hypothetical protein